MRKYGGLSLVKAGQAALSKKFSTGQMIQPGKRWYCFVSSEVLVYDVNAKEFVFPVGSQLVGHHTIQPARHCVTSR